MSKFRPRARRWATCIVLAGAMIALVAASSASAAVISNQRFEMVETIQPVDVCIPEPVTIFAEVHLVLTDTFDQNGGDHFGLHFNEQGQGVTASGVKYVLNNTGEDHITLPSGGAETTDLTIHLHILRQGSSLPADDRVFKEHFHLTITPNGDVTVDFDRFSASCS